MINTGIFITGCPRSGTTLLQSILSSHSTIFTAPETSFFSRIIPRLGVEYSEPDTLVDQHCLDIITESFREMTGIELPPVFTHADGETSIKSVFENLLAVYNPGGKTLWVEKTTLHARNLMAIRRFYPEASIINLIRDPVACVGSMSRIKPTSISDFRISYVSSLYAYASLWNDCVSLAMAYPCQHQVLHVHYESLVGDPDTAVNTICNFLDITYEEAMLESFHRSAAGIFSESSCPWQRRNLSPGISKEPVYKWRNRLSLAKIWLIQKYTCKYAMMLGYYEKKNNTSKINLLFALIKDQVRMLISASGIEMVLRRLISRSKHE